MKNFPKHQ